MVVVVVVALLMNIKEPSKIHIHTFFPHSHLHSSSLLFFTNTLGINFPTTPSIPLEKHTYTHTHIHIHTHHSIFTRTYIHLINHHYVQQLWSPCPSFATIWSYLIQSPFSTISPTRGRPSMVLLHAM